MGSHNPIRNIVWQVENFIDTDLSMFNNDHPYLVAVQKTGAMVCAAFGVEMLIDGRLGLSAASLVTATAINRVSSAHHDSSWTERDRRLR